MLRDNEKSFKFAFEVKIFYVCLHIWGSEFTVGPKKDRITVCLLSDIKMDVSFTAIQTRYNVNFLFLCQTRHDHAELRL